MPSRPPAWRTSSAIAPAMRSNASRVTYDDGIAPAQHDGNSVQPRVRAKSMKPATGMLMPDSRSINSGPRTNAGNESPRVKAVQSARLGANVLVSC